MREFLLIIKGAPVPELSPAEVQQRIADYRAWARALGEHYIEGERLKRKGALINKDRGVQTDGPFLESKEIIAGYVFIRTGSYDHALELARSCPLLEHSDILLYPVMGKAR